MHETGIRGSVRRVVVHLRSIAQLQGELARSELEQRGGTLGGGVVLALAAGVVSLFAVGFGLAAIAAALALVVDWWLALLIVFGALVVLAVALAFGSRALVRASTPLKPEQAIEEARLTKEVLRARGRTW